VLEYEPERSQQTLRHYAQMKRESDDYVIASGLDYPVLRPGTLTMEQGAGTIQIVSDVEPLRAPVAREDVAEVVLGALKAGLANKVIGFAGGSMPIGEALTSV
jgi:uncharacterized protein YbjT (DUF2867 family)